MKLILRVNVEALGNIGDVVEVSDGYARNYLIPKNLAMVATEGSMKVVEREKEAKKRQEDKLKDSMERLAKKLAAKSYTISKKAGEEEKLFGSVTKADIAEVINQEGFDIDKKKILLDESINQLGVFPVKIKLHTAVEAEVKIWVVKE